MAESLQDMIASRIGGVTRERMMRFYMDQGYSPAQAAALATAEMARRQEARPDEGFVGRGGEELAQMSRDFYRQNPAALASSSMDERSMPGYDPTRSSVAPRASYDPIMNRIEGDGQTQFSRPMTREDVNVARQTLPIPRGSADDYGSSRAPAEGGGSGIPFSYVARYMGDSEPAQPAQTYAQPQSLVERAIRYIGGNQRPSPVVSEGGARPVVEEARPSSYTGDDVDAEMYSRRYSPAMSSYTGDAADAAAYMKKYAPVARSASAAAPIPERPAGRTGANAEGAQGSGFFANLFRDPYAGKSSRDLYEQAQEMQRAGDEYGSNLLTQRAMSMGNPENMKRGGAAGGSGGGKDATIMKALEIIHHMLRGR
jgi:hypothetical protein